MENTEREETRATETQEETQETVLDDIMRNVTLLDPLEITMSSGKILEITAKQFISYYLPTNATDQEKANCFNEVRAAGLNPAVRGECHFFRTGDQPLHLFVGYPVYLRKAKEAGLEHYSIEFDNDEAPTICTVTLIIKDRDDFVWRTWFDEVASTNFKAELNARWKKAPRQMFIKCAVVNTIRMSMLFDLTMPHIIDEMPDAVAPGYRTLTQEELDAYEPQEGEQEAALGEVSATNHQLDMTPFRVKYFRKLGELEELGFAFANDEARRDWQESKFGVRHVGGFTVGTYAEAMDRMARIKAELLAGKEEEILLDDDYDPETEPVDGMSPEEAKREAEAQEAFAKEQERGVPVFSDPLKAAEFFWNEARTRFPDDGAITVWLATKSAKPWGEFSVTDWTVATKAVFQFKELYKSEPLPPQGDESDWDAVKQKADEEQAGLATEDPDPELETVQNEYDAFSANAFDTPTALTQWESIISDVPISKWNVLKYRAAIAGIKALKDARTEVKDVSDREALMKLYQEAIKGLWESTQDMSYFQRKVAGHNSSSDFNTNELKTAYIIARSLKAVQIASVEEANEVAEDFEVEDSEPEKEPKQPAVDPDQDKPFLITDDTVREIGEALLKFPDRKYLTIKSRAFRTFAFKAIEHEYIGIRKILDTDGKLILDALNEELQEKRPDGKEVIDGINERLENAEMTSDDQLEEMKALVKLMPGRFHHSIGSEAFRVMVADVLGRPHRGFAAVSSQESDMILARMKEIIKDDKGEE